MLPFSRFEARTLLKLSGPIVLAQLTQALMYFVDIVMSGHYSSIDMAAVAIACGLWLPIILTMQGLLLALTPIVAQYFGSNQTKPITHFTVQAMYLGLIIASLLFVLMRFIEYPIDLLAMEGELKQKTLDYLYYVSFALFPAAAYMVLRNLFEGIGYTKASMWISLVGLLVNIPVNYIFIYGKFGMPSLGGAGCGIATTLVFIAMFIAMTIYAWRSKATLPYKQHPKSYAPNVKDIWQIVCIGAPIAFAICFEVTLFACIPLVIVHLGAEVVAGHQVAQNFSALVFMLPLSLGTAALIRVGHLIGQQEHNELKKAISTAIIVSVVISAFTAILTYLFKSQIAALYSSDNNVITLAAALLVFACIYQITDAIQVVCASILRGMKITKPAFFITFVSYWPIGFGLGYVLALTDYIVPAMGVHGFWVGIIIGLTVAAILLSIVLKQQLNRLVNT